MAGIVAARVLPAPTAVARAGWELLTAGTLITDVAISARRALLGFVIGGGIGFVLGLVNGFFPWGARLLDSSVQMGRNIPHLALIPLVILWFGIGETARLFLVAIGVAFPIYINTYHGVRSVDTGLIEMSTTYGLTTWQLFRQVILPGALPSILVGVRYALGIMWLTLIVAESIAATSGIGYVTMNAREFLQTDVLVLGILLYALLGKLADVAARGLERRLLAWHPSYARREVWIGGCGGTAIALAGLTTGPDTEERIFMEVTTSGVAIEATALHKAFTTRQVLLGVDVTIAPGEFVAIVGQSGCGKSTLLRLMAGLDTPDSGVVALAGEPPRPGSPLVRMMFQDARLLPWRRVIDNVGLGLPVGRQAEAGSALAEVGLAERGGDWPSILSGGQRQRVALARALASRPRALLLDEPLGALDALTRLEMQGLIERVWQEHGFTAALVTHDVEEAVALADRIIVLSAGQVALDLQVDLPRPRDHAARRFTELKATVLDEVLGTRHERVARMHALSPAQADIGYRKACSHGVAAAVAGATTVTSHPITQGVSATGPLSRLAPMNSRRERPRKDENNDRELTAADVSSPACAQTRRCTGDGSRSPPDASRLDLVGSRPGRGLGLSTGSRQSR